MPSGSFYRLLARYSDLIFVLPASMAVGIGTGYLLDRWLSLFPWLTIAFGAVGTFAGFYQVFKIVTRKEE